MLLCTSEIESAFLYQDFRNRLIDLEIFFEDACISEYHIIHSPIGYHIHYITRADITSNINILSASSHSLVSWQISNLKLKNDLLKIYFTFLLSTVPHSSIRTALEWNQVIKSKNHQLFAAMEPVHHLSISSMTLLSGVRRMVPPMLEKFHKGLPVFHIICLP